MLIFQSENLVIVVTEAVQSQNIFMSCLDFKVFRPLYAYKVYAYKKKVYTTFCKTEIRFVSGIFGSLAI